MTATSDGATRTDSSFAIRLRLATAAAHRRLEDEVGFAPGAMDEAGVRAFLEGIYGFLRVWEPWAERSKIDAAFLRSRSKLAVLEQDLTRLGSDVDSLPLYRGDLGEPDILAVHGSLYVIEGSTLGGRLIARWLAEAAWLPAGGLGYFEGYGLDNGVMWRAFQQRLLDIAETHGEQGIIVAANATFERLQCWLRRRKVP